MAARLLALAVVGSLAPWAQATDNQAVANSVSNPIRKVVNLLQSMQKKVQEEGEREKELYDKFVCYYKTGRGDLEKSIAEGEAHATAAGSEIEASEGKLTQSKADLAQAQTDRASAKEAVASATALREKEAAAFASTKADYDTNIAAIAKAVAALEKGAAGSFLQTPAAQALRRIATDSTDLSDLNRQVLVSFLSAGADYAPQSGDVTGILKEIGDTFSKALAEATAAEQTSIKLYEDLVSAKTKEIEALTETVEAKTQQVGELGVAIVQLKADLSDTEATLLEDKKFLAELEGSYSTKVAEWEERSKTRADELVALADTIKVLNDDDALELFKKTLPSASSLLQVQMGAVIVRGRALAVIQAAQGHARRGDRAALDLIALALAGKKALNKGGFEQVIKLIDNLVAELKKEQEDDISKKEYCGKQLDTSDDTKKQQELSISDDEKAIATAEEAIKTLTADIASLAAGITALDKLVSEATEQRQKENAEYKDLFASDSAAKELLSFAKNRLNKFYNPKLYKAAPKKEMSTEDRIYTAEGGVITTAAPGGIAGTGIAVLAQVRAHAWQRGAGQEAPAPPPETWGPYQTKTEEGHGVIALIDLLIKDLDKELAEAETDEKDAQKNYEQLTKDSADKRAADLKAHSEKLSAKADTEARLEAHKQSKAATTKDLLATLEYIQSLHSECDWLLKYFDQRQEARAGEVDSLTKAKAVLSGADFSLLQKRGFLRRTAQ